MSRHQLLEMMVLDRVYSPQAAPAEKKTLASPRAWDQPGEWDTEEHSGPGARHARSCCLSALRENIHQKIGLDGLKAFSVSHLNVQ